MGQMIPVKSLIKGVNAATGDLSQPEGTIIRASNLVFNARGALQTTDGTAIIGQIQTDINVPRAIGTFSTLRSGEYPYYPAICSPPGNEYIDIGPAQLIGVVFNPGTQNAPGVYTLAIVGHDVNFLYNTTPILLTQVALATFGSVTFTFQAQAGVIYNVLYYPSNDVAGGQIQVTPNAQAPVSGPFSVSTDFMTHLPTSPLTTSPGANNTYFYGLVIGNITPPSKQVVFTRNDNQRWQAAMPEPAALAPGDPNFQFQGQFAAGTGGVMFQASGLPLTAAGNTYTTPVSNQPVVASGPLFPSTAFGTPTSVPIVLSYNWDFYVPVDSSMTMFIEASIDGGTTWSTIVGINNVGNGSGRTTAQGSAANQSFTLNGVTDPALIRLRWAVSFAYGATGAEPGVIVSSSITAASISVPGNTTIATFTPYGGVLGIASPIPQVLQYTDANSDPLTVLILGNGIPPQLVASDQLSLGAITPVANTFVALYPEWQAQVAWNVGDSIQVQIPATTGPNYQFTATVAGVSGATAPSWPTALGAQVQDAQVVWKNAGQITAAIAPAGAAHGIVFAGSLWIANTYPFLDFGNQRGPNALQMSDSNNPNSWNPANIAFVGGQDGTQITGLASFTIAELGIAPTGSLVVFKEFSTYQIIGVFGASDFTITQAQTDLGCIGARSIQFLSGYGICRFTHMGFAIFDGMRDTLISEEIRPYIFGANSPMTADITGIDFGYAYLMQSMQTTNPPMYIVSAPLQGSNGSMTRMFIYDMVLKCWTIFDLPFPVSAMMMARVGDGAPLSVIARGDASGLVERMFAGDQLWESSSLVPTVTPAMLPISWSVTSPHMYRGASEQRQFYRRVVVRGHIPAGDPANTVKTISCSLTLNGNPFRHFTKVVQPQPYSSEFEFQINIMETAQMAALTLSGQGRAVIDGISWDVTSKPGGRIMIG